jgi:hypothetical protein
VQTISVRQRRHMPMAGASYHELTSVVQLQLTSVTVVTTRSFELSRDMSVSHCTGGLRAVGDPGTTDSGSRLTSHDVMLPAARAPSRALCEAILPISQQRAALLPRSSRAVAGAVGEGRRGGRQRAERRGELCACREEG